jgi:3',5'-cyclic AMP phosphodiesterase CpdA
VFVFAHVSDLHLDGGERANGRAARVLNYLGALPRPIDAVLVSGDIADHGETGEYEEAAKLLALPVPVLHCPGNHDHRAPYRSVLLGESGTGPINRLHRFENGPAFLLCDSSVPGENGGLLAPETLDWVAATLAALPDHVETFLVFHHPPVLLHQPLLDSIMLADTAALAALVVAYPQVVAVLVGHAHSAAAATFAGRPLLVAPGTVSTTLLPWESDETVSLELPPALAFHVLDEGRLTTHFRVMP